MISKKGKNLNDVMEEACRGFGSGTFTSYQVYSTILNIPRRSGRKRHYTLTYSEVKQRLARADYVEKLKDDIHGAEKITRYRNKGSY